MFDADWPPYERIRKIFIAGNVEKSQDENGCYWFSASVTPKLRFADKPDRDPVH